MKDFHMFTFGVGGIRRPRIAAVTWLGVVLTATSLLMVFNAAAPDGAIAADNARPGYNVLRQKEDWSFLKDGAGDGGDIFDPIKYIALDDDGWAYLSLGGQVRERVESWQNFGFNTGSTPNADEIFLQTRLRYHADVHLGDSIRFFVEGKSAFMTDRDLPGGQRTGDVDELALQNGFAEFKIGAGDGNVTFRGGRQELLFGVQRLISPLDWGNTRRTFDGVTAAYRSGNFTATGFYTNPVTVKKYDSNPSNDQVDFFGIYATRLSPDFLGGGYDLYWLTLDREIPLSLRIGDSIAMNERRHTVGLRVWGSGDLGDYELESAFQFGDYGSDDIRAFMITVQTGFHIPLEKGRLEFGVDYASGDNDPEDGENETFNQLFPLGHAFLGYIDVVGRQNIVDLRVSTSAASFFKTKVKLDWHYFMRAQKEDALYNAGGGVLRAGAPGTPRDVGGEIDLTVKRKVTVHGDVIFGYSHFFADDFLQETGASGDIDFAYLILQYTV